MPPSPLAIQTNVSKVPKNVTKWLLFFWFLLQRPMYMLAYILFLDHGTVEMYGVLPWREWAPDRRNVGNTALHLHGPIT
jgi:hypothetical protein